jgi:hypothetical protein
MEKIRQKQQREMQQQIEREQRVRRCAMCAWFCSLLRHCVCLPFLASRHPLLRHCVCVCLLFLTSSLCVPALPHCSAVAAGR